MDRPGASPRATSKMSVPLFPLPNVFLIPGALLPLHIFEERYRVMVKDLLDGSGQLIIGTALDPQEVSPGDSAQSKAPRVHPLAGLGRLDSYQKLPDGRFVILVRGLARVRIQEAASAKPYRAATFEIVREVPVAGVEAPEIEAKLRVAIAERASSTLTIPEGVELSQLVDLLLIHLKLPAETLSELFGVEDLAQRARKALAVHAKKPS